MGTHVGEGGGETVTEAPGAKGSNGAGKVCLREEMLPCPLQQKAQVSKSVWVEISVLSSEMRMGECLSLSRSSCVEDV